MSAANDAMKTLTQQWYNTLTAGIGLVPSQFQLFQGSTSLGNTDDTIWRFFDAIPPVSVNNYFDPAQYNSLAQAYGGVINNLVPQNEDSMQDLLTNKYMSWTKFAKDPANLPSPLPKTDSGSIDVVAVQVEQFQTWGLTNAVDAGIIKSGVTLIKQTDIVSVAITSWAAANGVYAYTATTGSLADALNKGQAKGAKLNSLTESTDTTHTWAKVSASGLFDFFSAGGSGSWDKFTEEIHTEGVNLDVEYATQTTLTGGPYAIKAPTSTDLENYNPWWNSETLKTAQSNNTNKVWKHTAPTWDQTFGPNGNMQRLSTALVVVDGIKSTMTSKASVSKTDRASFKAAISGGFWPFFSVSGEGGWEHTTTFNDDGSFTVTSECKPGNPNVLGVLVDPIDAVIGKS